MSRIVEDDRPPIPGSFGDPLIAFLKECFHKDPAQRQSAEELLGHGWFKQHLRLDQVRRNGATWIRRLCGLIDVNLTSISTNLQDLPLDNCSPIRASVSPNTSRLGLPLAQPNRINVCEHTIVKSTFKQRTLNPSSHQFPFTHYYAPSSCQLPSVPGVHEKGRNLVPSMQPHSSFQVRPPAAEISSP